LKYSQIENVHTQYILLLSQMQVKKENILCMHVLNLAVLQV